MDLLAGGGVQVVKNPTRTVYGDACFLQYITLKTGN